MEDFNNNQLEKTNEKKEEIKKDDKFKKSAEVLVNKIFKDLTTLSELSVKHKGSYTKEEIEIIFNALKKKTLSAKKSFTLSENEEDTFTF